MFLEWRYVLLDNMLRQCDQNKSLSSDVFPAKILKLAYRQNSVKSQNHAVSVTYN